MLDVGDVYTGTATVKDTSGNLVDSTVTCTITLPDGTSTSPTPSHPSTGVYTISYPITQAGLHYITFTGTSPAFAQNDSFYVNTPQALIVPLSEARKAIGTAAANTVQDDDIRTVIAGATPIMEDLIGTIVPRQLTETYNGGTRAIMLRYWPVLTITAVSESRGAAATPLTAQNLFDGSILDGYGYSLDAQAGILTRLSAGTAVNFWPGFGNIQVQYTAGQRLAGNHLLAARRLIRWLWQTEMQGFRPAMGTPDAGMGTSPSGYLVPTGVLELCADSLRGPIAV